jgi:hypothetical protein
MPTYHVTLTLKVTTKDADAAKVKAKIGDPKVLERMQNKVEYGASTIEVLTVNVEPFAAATPSSE